MLSYIIIIWAALIACSQGAERQHECRSNMLEICVPPGNKINQDMTGLLPDEVVLNKHCGPSIAHLNCLLIYNTTCETADPVSGITFRLLRDFLEDICDRNTALGRGYRENVQCVNNNEEELGPRFRRITEDIDRFMLYSRQELGEVGAQHAERMEVNFCLYLRTLPLRTSEILAELCGEDAVRVMNLMVKSFLVVCPPPQEMNHIQRFFDDFLNLQRDAAEYIEQPNSFRLDD